MPPSTASIVAGVRGKARKIRRKPNTGDATISASMPRRRRNSRAVMLKAVDSRLPFMQHSVAKLQHPVELEVAGDEMRDREHDLALLPPLGEQAGKFMNVS
jgi:hypothetical protein